MAKTPDAQSRLADATFRLLMRTHWSELTLAAVARSAKVPLEDMQVLAPSKASLIALMLRRASGETSKRYRPDSDSNVRDRVLDASLTWFESMHARKPALRALHQGLKRDPLSLIAARGAFLATGEWLVVLAEADTGNAVPLKAAALAAILARAMGVWVDDDKEMTRTMAQLDGDLRRAAWLF